MQSAFLADSTYGPGRVSAVSGAAPTAPTPEAGGHPTAKGDATDDPHDRSDHGPVGIFDDPTLWIVLIAAAATGVIGMRFNVGGNKVDLGDQAAMVAGTTMYSIVGILLFKIAASKIEIPALQQVAAAI